MDETDLRILREMFIDRTYRLGGADPTMSAARIAAILRLSHTTVVRRLRSWKEQGFLDGFFAFPNPALLGREIVAQILYSESPEARESIRAQLPKIPEVAFGWEVGRGNIWLGYLSDGSDSPARGAEILAKVPKVAVAFAQYPYPMPPCSLRMSRTDWRIVQAIRAFTSNSIAEVADRLKMNLRTARRHLDRLLAGRALLYMPRLDHSKTNGSFATVYLDLDAPEDAPKVWRAVHDAVRTILPAGLWGAPDLVWRLDPRPQWRCFISFFVVLRSPADLPSVVRPFEGIPGVRDVETEFPYRVLDFPGAIDDAIARRLGLPDVDG